MPTKLRMYADLAELLVLALNEWHATGLVTGMSKLNMCLALHTSNQHFDSYCCMQLPRRMAYAHRRTCT
jgi:hypothetical protein